MNNYNIGTQISEGDNWSGGIAYVTIPSDIDRDLHIARCKSIGSLFIKTEDGGFYKDVKANVDIFDKIEWPQQGGGNGSIVAYIQEPVHKSLIVLCKLTSNGEIIDVNENEFKIKRIFQGNTVEISGSSENGYINVNIDSQNDANLTLHVNNANQNAELNIEVSGDIKITALNKINVISRQNIIFVIQDPIDSTNQSIVNISPSGAQIQTQKFSINDGTEPIALAYQTKTIFDAIIDQLGKATVTTNMGQQPLLNAQQIIDIKQNTANIFSEISFTD